MAAAKAAEGTDIVSGTAAPADTQARTAARKAAGTVPSEETDATTTAGSGIVATATLIGAPIATTTGALTSAATPTTTGGIRGATAGTRIVVAMMMSGATGGATPTSDAIGGATTSGAIDGATTATTSDVIVVGPLLLTGAVGATKRRTTGVVTGVTMRTAEETVGRRRRKKTRTMATCAVPWRTTERVRRVMFARASALRRPYTHDLSETCMGGGGWVWKVA